MLWIVIVAAAQINIALPERGGILDVFRYQDVPVSLIPNGEARQVNVRVSVDPDGKIRACEIESTSRISRLDALTCSIIRKRARLHPAVWSDGTSAYAVIRKTITWTVNANFPQLPADIEITVKQLPKSVRSPTYVYVMFAVDETGHPAFCREESRVRHPVAGSAPELFKVACAEVIKGYIATPARDETGKPVRSIQNAVVKITADNHS